VTQKKLVLGAARRDLLRRRAREVENRQFTIEHVLPQNPPRRMAMRAGRRLRPAPRAKRLNHEPSHRRPEPRAKTDIHERADELAERAIIIWLEPQGSRT
jgi:hypothetical protein